MRGKKITSDTDERSPERRARDEQGAAESLIPPIPLPPNAPSEPLEAVSDDAMPDPLYDLLTSVRDKTTFLRFVEALRADRELADKISQSLDGFQGEWANQTIEGFLEAATRWGEVSTYCDPLIQESDYWRFFAYFLWAGRGYE